MYYQMLSPFLIFMAMPGSIFSRSDSSVKYLSACFILLTDEDAKFDKHNIDVLKMFSSSCSVILLAEDKRYPNLQLALQEEIDNINLYKKNLPTIKNAILKQVKGNLFAKQSIEDTLKDIFPISRSSIAC